MEAYVYKLKNPVTNIEGEMIDKLTFQPLTAKHLRTLTGNFTPNDLLNLAGKLTGLTTDEIDKLSGIDALEVVEIVAGFLGYGQKTGKASTQS